jgi:hypothetical protein
MSKLYTDLEYKNVIFCEATDFDTLWNDCTDARNVGQTNDSRNASLLMGSGKFIVSEIEGAEEFLALHATTEVRASSLLN